MLENFMGAEEFRIGVKRFLERFKYGNAMTIDLWKELEGVSSFDLNITGIMDTWTRQMGYPLITVRKFGSWWSFVLLRASINQAT